MSHINTRAAVFAPSPLEAENILNCPLTSYPAIEEGAQTLLEMGAKSVFLQGEKVYDDLFSQDYWTDGTESFWVASLHYPKNPDYKAEDIISSIMALGYSVKDAIVIAKMYANRGSTEQPTANNWPEEQGDLPWLSPTPLAQLPPPFRRCETGLYPVVDSSEWIEKLLPQGVKCIQLRIKDADQAFLEEEIKRSVSVAKHYGAILFVNDYWELAIRLGAQGVHLGQEDLPEADIDAIRRARLYLGVSTHCYYEVARAHAINPSYIACGPIYSTTSKIMAFDAQGIERLQRWRRTLDYPLVAIGGINLQRLPDVLQTGVEGVSLISAITQASDPLAATQQFLTQMNKE